MSSFSSWLDRRAADLPLAAEARAALGDGVPRNASRLHLFLSAVGNDEAGRRAIKAAHSAWRSERAERGAAA